MTRVTLAVALIALTSTAADARRYHHAGTHHATHGASHARHGMAWCGAYMRSQVGGDPGPDFNLARNWARWGSASSPGVGAVVVWSHHVGIIVGQENGQWIMRSGNDGGRVRTRPLSMRGVIAIRRGGGGTYASAQHDEPRSRYAARGRTAELRAPRRDTSSTRETLATREVARYDRQDERSAEQFGGRYDPVAPRDAAYAWAPRRATGARAAHRRIGQRLRRMAYAVPAWAAPSFDPSTHRGDQYLHAAVRPQGFAHAYR